MFDDLNNSNWNISVVTIWILPKFQTAALMTKSIRSYSYPQLISIWKYKGNHRGNLECGSAQPSLFDNAFQSYF